MSRKKSIPYKEIIKFCAEHNISLDEVFGITPPSPHNAPSPPLKLRGGSEAGGVTISEAPPPEYVSTRLQALIEKMKVIYNEGTFDEQSKLRGAIENIIDDINERKEEEKARKAHAFPEEEKGKQQSA